MNDWLSEWQYSSNDPLEKSDDEYGRRRCLVALLQHLLADPIRTSSSLMAH